MLQLDRSETRHRPAEAQRVYVYGIIREEEGGERPNVPPLEGLAGNPIRIVANDGLAAIVSMLEPRAAGAPFEEDLKDPERAKSLILDHHRVLRQIIDDRTVLPTRFGALFADDRKVVDALNEHRHGLFEALERVQGAREWGVKIFSDRSVLCRHLGEESPAMRAAQRELAGATEGRAFFLRRRIAQLSEEEAGRAIAQTVEASRRSLCDVARADAAMKLQPAGVHGRADEMVWNGALLVAKAADARFFALIGELLQVHAPRGFHYETNGPWPPFNFADCRLGVRENGCSNGA
jgi:hypothetical protein